MIQMTEKEYLQLKADSDLLNRLYANGVENWIGFEDCIEEEEPPVGDRQWAIDQGLSLDVEYPDDDFPLGVCNPNAPEECESCQ